MQIGVSVDSDVEYIEKRQMAFAAKATTSGVKRATFGLRKDLRRQIARAGLGSLEKALRGGVRPNFETVDIEGRVFSKARVKRPGGVVDLIGVFEHATEIRAAGSGWLAIPTREAGRVQIGNGGLGRNKRPTPRDFAGRLAFRPIPGRRDMALLVGRVTGREVKAPVYFVLVRRVRLKKRLNVGRSTAKWTAKIDTYIASTWERLATRAGI